MLKIFVAIWYTHFMISLDHGEKIANGLFLLGGIAAILYFPLWAAPFVLLAYVVLLGPWLVVLLPILVIAGIGCINLFVWLFQRLSSIFIPNTRSSWREAIRLPPA